MAIQLTDITDVTLGAGGVWRFSAAKATTVRAEPATYVTTTVEPTVLTITDPLSKQCFHVDPVTRTVDIPVTVTWTGPDPASIRARFAGQPWQTLVVSPTGGTGSGTLVAQAAGQGALQVQAAGSHAVYTSPTITAGIIIFVYGQSNAVGSFANQQIYTGAFESFKWPSDGTQWSPMDDPVNFERVGGKGSLWPLVATKLSDYLGIPVVVVSSASGGTGYVADEGQGTEWATPSGAQYLNAIDVLQNSGINGAIGIQVQGEREAGPNTITSRLPQIYKDSWESTRAGLSAAAGFTLKVMPVQIGSQLTAGTTNLNLVRQAHREFWDEGGNWLPGPSTMDQALDPTGYLGGQEQHHWTTDEQADTISDRIVHCLKFGVFGAEGGRGPRFASGLVVDSTHIAITFTVSNGTLSLGATPVGFRVVSGSVQTITSVSLDGSTITLTLSAPLPQQPAIVSFGYGDDAAGSSIRDSAGLVIEPFIEESIWDSDGPDAGSGAVTIDFAWSEADSVDVRAGLGSYVGIFGVDEPGDDTPPDLDFIWFSDVASVTRNEAGTFVHDV